ncbi:unnamed protein product [Auanema sp. JU1783]|nr:unnamed protein product [Auanema sp. JU1783]
MSRKAVLTNLWLAQSRTFFSRHVFEPRLLVRNPTTLDGNTLEVVPEKPVVLLLGWAGARYSYIEKYAKIYNDQGYRTVSFASPCYHYRIPNSRYGFYMSPLFRAIDAKPGDFRSFDRCPIIVHIFSMNGVRALISLWKWTEAEQREDLRKRIKGVVFDSAPGMTQAGPCAHAVVQSTPPLDGLEWIDQEFRRKYIKAMYKLRNFIANPLCYVYPPIRAHLSQFYYLQTYVNLPGPQLYIFSENDTMVKHKYIDRFMQNEMRQGKDVKFLRFTDSKHVKHLLEHPQEYSEACIDLMNRTEKSLLKP